MEVNVNGVLIDVNPIDMNGASVYGAPMLLSKNYEGVKNEEDNWIVKNIRCGGCNSILSGFENYCPCCGGQIGETSNPVPPQENEKDNDESTN